MNTRIMLVLVVILLQGCTNTLRGVGQLVRGVGQDVVNIADDNDSGTANRYNYVTVKR